MRAQPSREPASTLDRPSGRPFREFVLKLQSRCDLACDYCYLYAMADQSWRAQPARMTAAVASQAAARIGEHVRWHDLRDITVVLHGGEPLLAGRDLIAHVVTSVRDAVPAGVTVTACVQTNGVRLDEDFLGLFARLGVGVGVSVDGGAAAQDRHRRFATGKGSYTRVAAGLELLTSARYRHLFRGLLAVIDLRNDPLATYGALLSHEPPHLDFLLPHGTWDTPPPGRVPGSERTPYADWLIPVFDLWYREPRTRIRLFAEIIRALLGGTSAVEGVGVAAPGVVVIGTGGEIEHTDTLKAAYHGAARTGLSVLRDSLDAAIAGPVDLCDSCQGCRLRRVCAGGLLAHRYRSGTGYANPSVYCPDLMCLIDHVSRVVRADLSTRGVL